MEQKLYKRKYMRIKPDMPLYGTLDIVDVRGKAVTTGKARIRILDICPGGLRFVSSLKFPVDSRVIMEISFAIEDSVYCICGYIVHSCGIEKHEYGYGFSFKEPDEYLKDSVRKLFTSMSVRSNRHIVILRL